MIYACLYINNRKSDRARHCRNKTLTSFSVNCQNGEREYSIERQNIHEHRTDIERYDVDVY